MKHPISILHIITGLSTGGAETMLFKLLSGMDKSKFDNQVVSLLERGPVADKIEALGIPVQSLCMPRGIPDPRGVWKMGRLIRKAKPDVIQTWMYHADLMGGLAAKSVSKAPVIWGIHHSNLDPKHNKKTTIWTVKLCSNLSTLVPERIVCCSNASEQVHANAGYYQDKMIVIPNGFDLKSFGPNRPARASVRQELGLAQDALLLGMVARFDPQKDHDNLVRAASHLKDGGIDAFFVLCGNNINENNPTLQNWLKEAGLIDRFFLLGPRDDIPRINAALDIACLSSIGEGFPNVLGEAMACEVPCVATDVGDSAAIIGDTGRIVPPKDPEEFAQACKELIDLGAESRAQLGKAARQRVETHFELGKVVRQYEDLYRAII